MAPGESAPRLRPFPPSKKVTLRLTVSKTEIPRSTSSATAMNQRVRGSAAHIVPGAGLGLGGALW